MRIFINQNKVNNINEISLDPSLVEATGYWGKEGIIEKSAIDLRFFKTPFGSISLLYGPRQIGKTASLKFFLSRLHDSETVIFTDCSAILDKDDLGRHLSALIGGKTTIVLDEVQSVPNWHLALRSLFSEGRLKQCRIWCTGSEARHLLESGERLPGRRGEGRNLFARPWSFREYVDFFYPERAAPYRDLSIRHLNQKWLDDQTVRWDDVWGEYCRTGGIPHAGGGFCSSGTIADSVWRTYIDWILGNWSKLRTPERSLSAVARRLCETMNSRVSYETIKKGTDIQSANTIRSLLEMQEDHFAIRSLPRMDLQRKKFLPAKLKKVYPIDPFIARIWAAIGSSVRRLYEESVPGLSMDECAFLTQTHRWGDPKEVSYLYQDTSKSEVDFYFDECGFELKSNGNPTSKQMEILRQCPQAFVVKKGQLPLVAYMIGEGRTGLTFRNSTV